MDTELRLESGIAGQEAIWAIATSNVKPCALILLSVIQSVTQSVTS